MFESQSLYPIELSTKYKVTYTQEGLTMFITYPTSGTWAKWLKNPRNRHQFQEQIKPIFKKSKTTSLQKI